jgi:subtilisin family serine protease
MHACCVTRVFMDFVAPPYLFGCFFFLLFAVSGRGVTVGVADTGIDVDMPYFYDPGAPAGASFGMLNTVRSTWICCFIVFDISFISVL